jgi:predicted ATPase
MPASKICAATNPRHHSVPATGPVQPETVSLVGRAHELAVVERLLRTARLVTLTGTAGVGKTRLARRAAAAAAPDFPDGVRLVDLSLLDDPSLLVHTVATALLPRDRATLPLIDVIDGFLGDRSMLLVLDTCDAQVEACADLAEVLLRAAPGLAILATSRRAFGMMAEHVVQVAPLPVPPDGPAASAPAEPCAAVALFGERAAAWVPGFALAPETLPAVESLCRRLEGVPLAIELAARRLTDLSLAEVADGLDDCFALLRDDRYDPLSGGAAAGPPNRHASLRTAIGWSHELCTPPERLLWSRLSVFPGVFDVRAAEAVCASRELPPGLVFELILCLVDRSIVVAEEHPDGMRYRMPVSMREFGHEWLARVGEGEALRLRHEAWRSANSPGPAPRG